MTRCIILASGKGGTGKTIAALNISTALSEFGRDTILVDCNFTTPDVSTFLGLHSPKNTIEKVLEGKKDIKDVIYMHPCGIKVVPSIVLRDKKIDTKKLHDTIKKLQDMTEIVVIDANTYVKEALVDLVDEKFEVLIVTCPDIISQSDALKVIRIIKKRKAKITGILLNRVGSFHGELTIKNTEQMLKQKVIGEIPDDSYVQESIKTMHPVVYSYPKAPSTIAFKKIAASIIGETYRETLDVPENMFSYILRIFGIKK